mmetsp:Transcript_54726/g.108631  ORF Transcript_54726/g.108631 Transcript_54726/m.108631 type:complete len:205 (-) Transcript_54726:665-1279(-)
MVASHPNRTISFSVTTSIEVSRASRPSACCSLTRSSIPRTFSCCVATTSARRSTASMASTTSASGGIRSSCGRPSRIASIAYPSPLSSMRRSYACMAASRQTYNGSTRSLASCGRRTCRTRDCYAICCGPILTRMSLVGATTTGASLSLLDQTWSPSFWMSTTWTSCAVRTRLSRTAMSFSPSGSLSPCSPHRTIVASSTMRAP